MLMTSQLKVGTAFMYEGAPLIVQKMLGQRSGRAGMVTSLRVKNLVTNSTMDLGIDAGEKFDEVDLESHVTKLSYVDGDTFVFMDQDTYEQFELAKDDLGKKRDRIRRPGDHRIRCACRPGDGTWRNLGDCQYAH